jgi:hypothetical protein
MAAPTPPDFIQLARRPSERLAIVTYVHGTANLQETEYLEWKSAYDLSKRPGAAATARQMIGMANRDDASAGRHAEGHARATAKVGISDMALDAQWTGPLVSCVKDYFGILVGGGGNLTLTGSQILHAGANPMTDGCQRGVAVLVGHAKNSQIGTATLTNDQIRGYQKNGPTIDGKGSSAIIKGVTVTGAGPDPAIAQNGIEVSRGAWACCSHSAAPNGCWLVHTSVPRATAGAPASSWLLRCCCCSEREVSAARGSC